MELKVGRGRMYVVRNLWDFTRRILKGEYFSYGKGLAFIHHRLAFDPRDMPIVHGVMFMTHTEVAPELGEWAQFFAAGAAKRAAAEAGLRGVVSEREADDLVRDSEAFLARVARLLGVPHQPLLGGPSAAAS